jgi:hypothetical protein
MNKLLVKANEEVEKVVEYMNKNEDMFDMMDLKLYDVQSYRWKEMEKDFPLCYKEDKECTSGYDTFYYFCDDSYDMFVEDLKESFNIDFDKMRKQVGRTSKFYLADWVETTHCRLNIYDTIETLLCDCATLNYTNITDDFNIEPYGDFTLEDEQVIDELEEMAGFYDWFIEKIEDVKTVYDLIKDFKDNQVKYYKEYLECKEEDMQDEIDKELEEDNKRKEEVKQIKEKYDISDEDMKILSVTIN